MTKIFGEIVLSPLTMMQLQCIHKHQNRAMFRDTFSLKCNKIQNFLPLGYPPFLSYSFHWFTWTCVLQNYFTYYCSILPHHCRPSPTTNFNRTTILLKSLLKNWQKEFSPLPIILLPLHQDQTKFNSCPQNMASSSCFSSHSWSPVQSKNLFN